MFRAAAATIQTPWQRDQKGHPAAHLSEPGPPLVPWPGFPPDPQAQSRTNAARMREAAAGESPAHMRNHVSCCPYMFTICSDLKRGCSAAFLCIPSALGWGLFRYRRLVRVTGVRGGVEIFSYGKGTRRVLAAFRCFPMPGKAVEGSKPGLWMAPSNPARPAPAQSGAYSDVDPQTCCSVYS